MTVLRGCLKSPSLLPPLNPLPREGNIPLLEERVGRGEKL